MSDEHFQQILGLINRGAKNLLKVLITHHSR